MPLAERRAQVPPTLELLAERWRCQLRHFASVESAEEFSAERPACFVVELSELQDVADTLYEASWRATRT